ncbi:DNA polymerase I [Microbacterium amylolyticum]|uniref:DNA polymerase I n=1 Tax=Microbacterium amylolyticum TaxID=936337 RepID=A0ABS4ZE56_9MICO|nr:DNA polymerase I [Microbacterium amylolyticum]MBP2435568.1 DNA polymerase-1 [Microbacterium amylolyticum]
MTDPTKPTLLVVDGHSLAFRAFFALPVDSFQNREGQHTNGIHGFLSMFINLLKNEKPTHVAVAFDVSDKTFRKAEYPEYKEGRSETPAEFAGQIPLLKQCLEAMNITVLEKDGFEADDILATLARRGVEEGYDVLVCSGDRDSIQLVNQHVTLLYPSVQGVSQLKRYDPPAVEERYGIPPHQYPDVAALVGEKADNLPGVPKVGEKTAVKWLTQFGSLDAIIEGADGIKGVVGQNLRDHLDDVRRNRRLNRLLDDLDIPVDLDRMEVTGADDQAVRDIFSQLEFRSLLKRVLDAMGSGDATEPDVERPVAPAVVELDAEALAGWFTDPQAPIGLTVSVQDGLPARLGLATADAAVEVPWNAATQQATASWFAGDAPKVMCDAKTQVKALRRAGVDVRGVTNDALIAGWIARPALPDKSLAHLVTRYLDEKLPEADPNQLVPENDGATPGQLAWYTLRVAEAVVAELPERSREVLFDIEMPTLLALADMELVGVAVSHEKLSGLRTELRERAATIAQQAYAEIGREVNLGSPKQLQQVLFEELDLPKTRKTKTGYTTDAGALADLQVKTGHPFLGQLLAHREVTKLAQIIESLDGAIAEDARVHTTYLQTGSQTGRLSSTDPNLQNIPVRTEESRRIRAAFEVGEGYEALLTADYSQIEMRIMAHLSADPGLVEAFRAGEDLHRYVGAQVFGVEPADVSSEMRGKVKAMSYGLVYGLSAFGLAKQLGIEQKEAKQLMLGYFERFGAVRDYLRASVEQAREDGYTETIFGRRRPFPDLTSPNRVLRENAERAALNAPIQGSAADIMKIALFRIHEDLRPLASRLLLQIHDEVVVEVAHGEWDQVEKIVRERMSQAADLVVPLAVQVGRGADWNEAAH